MTSRLGLAMGSRHLTAILVDRGRVVWHATSDIASLEALDAAIDHLMDSAPSQAARAHVEVGFSPAWVAVKPLHGLPPVKSSKLATQIVRENPRSFFLVRSSPVVIADVHDRRDGGVWGAAFDAEAVGALTRVLRNRRLRLARFGSTLSHLACLETRSDIRWCDGDVEYELDADKRGLKRVARSMVRASAPSMPHALLASVDGAGDGHVAALAAALAPKTFPLCWLPVRDSSQTRRLQYMRRSATVAALTLSASFALFARGARAGAFVEASRAELSRQRGTQGLLTTSEAELHRITETLNRIETFRSTRGSISGLLSELSEATPDSTALLSFRVDSTEGAFTAVAPHVADVLSAIAEVHGVGSPRIAGSVTREVVGGARLERATIRFTVGRPKATPAAPAQRGKP